MSKQISFFVMYLVFVLNYSFLLVCLMHFAMLHCNSRLKYSRTMQIFYLIILVKVFSNVQRSGDNVLKSVKFFFPISFFEIWLNFLEDCEKIFNFLFQRVRNVLKRMHYPFSQLCNF